MGKRNVSVKESLIGRTFNFLTVIEKSEERKRLWHRCWICRCQCGNELVCTTGELVSGNRRSCGCGGKSLVDLTGKTFGNFYVESLHMKSQIVANGRHTSTKWLCLCNLCKKKHLILKYREVVEATRANCGCTKPSQRKSFCGEISKTYLNTFKRHAEQRNLEISITDKEIWNLFLTQNRKCALSGIELVFGTTSIKQTASLDRIDSKKGYTLDNVQWIHKELNIMKNKYDMTTFLNWCKLITIHLGEKSNELL